MGGEAAEYHSKDFEWEELRKEVEGDPSLSYHYLPTSQLPSLPLPFSSSSNSLPSPSGDSQAWSHFHTRHSSGKFFKERRYLLKGFPELISCADNSKLLEVGCGNGSTVLPILRGTAKITVFACDCSPEALERARENIEAANIDDVRDRFVPFSCDFSMGGFPKWLVCDACREVLSGKLICHCSVGKKNEGTRLDSPSSSEEAEGTSCCTGGMDFVTLIFTLSSVSYQMMPRAISECFSVIKPGGLLFFRDYGLYDMTMLRFYPEKKVGFREYMRSDGTRSYFFSLDLVRDLFVGAGFAELQLDYCCVKSVNRLKGKCMRRVWVHGKFQKPLRSC
ncbi:hypothetical protein Dimus_021820 [Dionaea muscipula]